MIDTSMFNPQQSKTLSSPTHPQDNGQVEAVNKTIKENLKNKLVEKKGAWANELPFVLWAYQTIARNATSETCFVDTYRVEAIVPIEKELPTLCIKTFIQDRNDEAMRIKLDFIDEKRTDALTRLAAQKRRVKVHYRKPRPKKSVLKHQGKGSWSLGPDLGRPWEFEGDPRWDV